MANNIILLYANEREFYPRIEWLRACVAKRLARGEEVAIDYLENCATMRKIVSDVCKYARQWNESFSPEDRAMARREIAEQIINEITNN